MCQIWKEVLNIDKVGITDNFFNIGGNSILAITTIMRINKLTNKFYQVIDLFKSQTIQQLSNLEVNSNNISNERLNLTSEKLHHFEKVIFNHQLSSGENLIYNESFLIDYKKHIDLNNLKSGVKYLLDKYTLLHSNYVYNNDGCLKRILNYDSFCICEQKIVETQTELHQVLNEIERISFDLYTDKLIRFYLIDVLDTKKQYLFISCHHLILDATSLSNIILPDLYLYLFLNEKDNTKSDINNFNEASYYINKHYKNNFEEKLSFWKNKLEYLSPIDLSKNNQEFTNKGKQISFNCDKKTRTQLLKVSRNLNISKFSILYTLFTLVLYKISNQNKFAIITNVDERLYTPKHKDTIGCLINNMFLVSDFANNNDLSYFIYQAGSEIISNINNAIAYESLLDNLHREHIRLLSDIQFNFETEEIHSLPYNQTQIYSHSGYVKQGLYFEVDLKNDEILCRVEFNNQYEKDFIYTLINGYKNLLSRLDIILDKKISEISIIDDDQYKQILTNSIGKYRGYPQDKAIHQLFEEQVTKTPNNIAVVFEDKQLTYKELNQISNQLARYIKDKYKSITNKDLQPDTLIALYLDRSLEMIISILAVLKTGAAYVPISPEFPIDRTKYILDDTNASILLSQVHLTDKLNQVTQNIEIIATDDSQEFQNYDKHNLSNNLKPNNLAYVIYTSGTTGKPKGVALEHQGIINRIVWMQSVYQLTDKDKIVQKTPYNFDVSVWELLWANWYGATIVIARPDGHKDCDYLYQLINTKGITVIHFVPSMLDVFLNYLSTKETSQSKLKIVFCSGEALKNNTCDTFYKFNKNISLYNLYGPTEASIDVSYSVCERGKKVTIGKPISNTQLYILDNNLLPSPIGVPGELYIGGVGLARGYLNLPE
ncbi:AMP-binding protein, partial [Francisella tularensis subsp. novicida]